MRAILLGAAVLLGAYAQTPETPTSTPTPAPAPVSRANAIEPSGPAPLTRGGETVVDPASSFEIELPGRLADARLVLLDGADAHVPARSTREVGGTTQLTLTPASTLVPGSRYVLRVEGAAMRELREGGRVYAPVSFALLAAGTLPPPEPKRKPKAKKRR